MIILGCMQYGSQASWMINDHDEAIRQLKYAYGIGVNVGLYSRPGPRPILIDRFQDI